MARITALPLLSVSAHGVVGKRLIFRRSVSGAVHTYWAPDPALVNQAPATTRQAPVRSLYAQAVGEWRELTPVDKQGWHLQARQVQQGMTGWSLYFQRFMQAWQHQLLTDAGEGLLTDAGQVLME